MMRQTGSLQTLGRATHLWRPSFRRPANTPSPIPRTYAKWAGALSLSALLVWHWTNRSRPIAAEPSFPSSATPALPVASFDDPTIPIRHRMTSYVFHLQDKIVAALTSLDPAHAFALDEWKRPAELGGGGGGVARVLQNGTVFEKAGVNVSTIHGKLSEGLKRHMRSRGKDFDKMRDKKHQGTEGTTPGRQHEDLEFYVCGVSLVLHPHNPMAPTVHLNYRYFEVYDPSNASNPLIDCWFGGGSDLTPSYLIDEDAQHFHRTLKDACDRVGKTFYPLFKRQCDEYFYIPHREEARGIGGIFFDDLSPSANHSSEDIFKLVRQCGDAFVPSYLPLIRKRMDAPFTDQQRRWQQLRRGRYAEFNLAWDRGTKFGFATKGSNTEGILMSLPLTARWEYRHVPEPGSEEERTLNALKRPRDWA